MKEKAAAAQKPTKIFEASQRKAESNTVKNLRGNSMDKSWNGSVDAMPRTAVQDSTNGVKSKGKSISLALQAKANVQKRGGLTVNSVSQKEFCELSPNHPFKSQTRTTSQKSTAVKKASTQNEASVLRQNNQKQNCIVDRGKLSLKGGKTLSGESSSTRQRNSSKVSSTSRVNTRKLSSEVRDDRPQPQALSSSKERVTSKKRSVDGSYHLGKNQPLRNLLQSRDITERQSRWDQDSGGTGTDVVSFTFTAPMTRGGSDFVRSREDRDTYKILSVGYQSKRSLMSSNGTSASKFSSHVNSVKGGNALSTLLEQKLKELADKVEFSQRKSGTNSNDMVPCLKPSTSSSMPESCDAKDGMPTVDTVSQPKSNLCCKFQLSRVL